MNPYDIISEHYPKNSRLADILIEHSEKVTAKALAVAEKVPHLQPDTELIAEAAMLHDIGIYRTKSPKIDCHGDQPYVCHGVIGRSILEQYGMMPHALVCERHVGVGISVADIESQKLPLPKRDMVPATIEEIIICYADEFFSKTNGGREHSVERIVAGLMKRGEDKANRFLEWHRLLAPEDRAQDDVRP